MSKKYLKNENGLVRAVTTEVLELEKPLVNEFYDINVFNRNMDKIENALKNVSSSAEGTSFDNSSNGMTATNAKTSNDAIIAIMLCLSNILSTTNTITAHTNAIGMVCSYIDVISKFCVASIVYSPFMYNPGSL